MFNTESQSTSCLKKFNVIIVFLFLQYEELSLMKLDDLKMQDPKDKESNAAAEH